MASAAGAAGVRATLDLGSKSSLNASSVGEPDSARITGNPDATSATSSRGKEQLTMATGSTKKRKRRPVSLPDLDQAKSAVLNTLSSADAQRG
jgi:hypothetical protein